MYTDNVLLQKSCKNKAKTGYKPDLKGVHSNRRFREAGSGVDQQMQEEEKGDDCHRESSKDGFHGNKERDPRQADHESWGI